MEETHQHYVVFGVMCGLGLLEAPLGSERALEWAEKIEKDPMLLVSAVQIRMLYHLWQGDSAQAEACRQRVDVLRIQNSSRQFFEAGHLMAELVAHASTDDLIQLKQTLPGVMLMAENTKTWLPIQHYARGEYQRIRGAVAAALKEHKLASTLVRAGRHQMFCEIVGAHLRALNDLGQYQEARDRGAEQLKAAQGAGLGYTTSFIRMPLAVAYARLGEMREATALADQVLEELGGLGAGKLLMGLAHEARALVAIEESDQEAFDVQAAACGALLRAHANRALVVKHERLLERARRAGLCGGEAGDRGEAGGLRGVQLSTVLSGLGVASKRARRALELMVEQSGALAGALFAVDRDAPTMAAELGVIPDHEVLEPLVRETLLQEMQEDLDLTRTSVGDATCTAFDVGHGIDLGDEETLLHTVLVAHNAEGDFHITGLALFVVSRDSRFVAPTELAAQLSRYWHDIGDATALGTQAAWTRTRVD